MLTCVYYVTCTLVIIKFFLPWQYGRFQERPGRPKQWLGRPKQGLGRLEEGSGRLEEGPRRLHEGSGRLEQRWRRLQRGMGLEDQLDLIWPRTVGKGPWPGSKRRSRRMKGHWGWPAVFRGVLVGVGWPSRQRRNKSTLHGSHD